MRGVDFSRRLFLLVQNYSFISFFCNGLYMENEKQDSVCTPLFRRSCKLLVGVCFLVLILLSLSFMDRGWIAGNQIWWQLYLSSKEVISRCWLYFVGVSGIAALLLMSPSRTIIIYVAHRPLVQLSSRVARPEQWGEIEMLWPLFLCMAVLSICVWSSLCKWSESFFRPYGQYHHSEKIWDDKVSALSDKNRTPK